MTALLNIVIAMIERARRYEIAKTSYRDADIGEDSRLICSPTITLLGVVVLPFPEELSRLQCIDLIGSAMRSATELKDYVRREAKEMGVELESVREISDDGDGVTIRVLLEDGETESDQVGFQVSRPNVDTGRNMFNRRVANGLRELRSRLRDDSDSNSTDTDNTSDPAVNESSQSDQASDVGDTSSTVDNKRANSQSIGSNLGSLSVQVELEDDSRSELVGEFESVLDEIQESTVSEAQLDDLEERIDAVDSRLQKLEETLSMVGSN